MIWASSWTKCVPVWTHWCWQSAVYKTFRAPAHRSHIDYFKHVYWPSTSHSGIKLFKKLSKNSAQLVKQCRLRKVFYNPVHRVSEQGHSSLDVHLTPSATLQSSQSSLPSSLFAPPHQNLMLFLHFFTFSVKFTLQIIRQTIFAAWQFLFRYKNNPGGYGTLGVA